MSAFLSILLIDDGEKPPDYLRWYLEGMRSLNADGLERTQIVVATQREDVGVAEGIVAESGVRAEVVPAGCEFVDGCLIWDNLATLRREWPGLSGEYVSVDHTEFLLCKGHLASTIEWLERERPEIATLNLRRLGSGPEDATLGRIVNRFLADGDWEAVASLCECLPTCNWEWWKPEPKIGQCEWTEDRFATRRDWLEAGPMLRFDEELPFQDVYDLLRAVCQSLESRRRPPDCRRPPMDVAKAIHLPHDRCWRPWNLRMRNRFLRDPRWKGTPFGSKRRWNEVIGAVRKMRKGSEGADARVEKFLFATRLCRGGTVRRFREHCNRWANTLADVPIRIKSRVRVGLAGPSLMLGGAERWMLGVAANLDRARIDYAGMAIVGHVTLPNDPAAEAEARCLGPFFLGKSAVADLCRSCDVLVAWGLPELRAVPSTFPGRVVVVSHGQCDWTRTILKGCNHRATHRVAVSEGAVSGFPARSAVTVIRNGIDRGHCQRTVGRFAARKSWGLIDGEIAIGFVGRMAAEKNPQAVASAVAELGPGYRAVIVGDGYQRDRLLRECRSICPDLIYVGAVETVGDVYDALDCCVLATPNEGMSLGLCEAWWCGCPTVATPVGAVPELEKLHGPLTVRVSSKDDRIELAGAVLRAISPANFPILERAHRAVDSEYTVERMGERWTDYLRDL